MKLRRFLLMFATPLVLLLTGSIAQAQDTVMRRAGALLSQMTQGEKLDLISSGRAGIPRLRIPPVSFIDGPNGVGEGSKGVTAFPDAVNIAASWDPALAGRYGAALGAEARAKGHTLIAAPTLNIVRTPLWGRAAETFGEDPFLTSSVVAPEVRGIQSARVMAQAKHYAGNNQEVGRLGIPLLGPAVDDQVATRTLQEIYFPGFRAAVHNGSSASVMCSYNQINGTPSCQDATTLSILKKGFRLRGFVEPDATLAVRDVVAAVNAGVDNFQLGSLGGNERATLQSALAARTVSQARINDAARRILVGMIESRVLQAGTPTVKPTASTPAHRGLATSISEQATVLLQNRRVGGRSVLPLSAAASRIAVIGYDAGKGTQIEEGGSPAVLPGRPVVTPLSGIRQRAPRRTKVSYAKGTLGVVPLPIVPAGVLIPSSGAGHGLLGTFYQSNAPCCSGAPVMTRVDPTLNFATPTTGTTSVLQPIPGTSAGSARWTGTLRPPKTGRYRFSLTFAGEAKLFIAGHQVIDGSTEFIQGAGAGFPGAPDISYQGNIKLRAGHPVPITVEYATDASIGGAALHLGWQPPDPSLIAHAVAVARKADVAVVFANDVTSEGMDRSSLALPGDQDQLIQAVAKANPRTVVVLHTASAVLMPWRHRVAAILEAWYPGQQSGTAIAHTLFGDVDPSGRLPVTFPASDSQGPLAGRPQRYPAINNIAQYSEGLKVGYRWFDAKRERPLFPFGYGLSYTTFKLSALKVKASVRRRYSVSVHVLNTGRRTGAKVVAVYVGFPRSAGEPPRQLKAFAKVWLRPGHARTIRMTLDPSSFQTFDGSSNTWKITSGSYQVYAGSSSEDLPLRVRVALRKSADAG